MSLLSPKYLTPLILVSCLLATLPAGAAEYSVGASLNQDVFYDGNIGMGSVIEQEVEGYSFIPKFNLRAQDEAWRANLDTELRFTRMSTDLYDSDDQIVNLSLGRFSEKQALQLETAIRRESTRTVEDVEDVGDATRTEQRSVRPSWTRVLNEKNSLLLGGSWLDFEYDAPRYSDYEQYGLDATWIRQLSERLDLQVGAYNSRFDSGAAPALFMDPDLSFTTSVTTGLSTGLTRKFNEQLSGSVTVGTRKVDIKTRLEGPFGDCLVFIFGFCLQREIVPVTIETDSSGFTASGDLEYTGDRWSGTLTVSRSLTPSGFVGELLESDGVTLSYARQLSQQLHFNVRASFESQSSLDSGGFERDLWRLIPSLRWQFAERWSLITRLIHRSRDKVRDGRASDAEGTSIVFTVRYAHPRASWSR